MRRRPKVIEVLGYSYWASYLVNGDASQSDAFQIAEIQAWAFAAGVDVGTCRGIKDDAFTGRLAGIGMLGEIATYQFIK